VGELIQARTIWQEQVEEIQRQLQEVRPLLIEAEANLAERLAAIHAFEFKLRSRLEPLLKRVEKLDEEIRRLRADLRRLQEEGPQFEADEADEWLKKWRLDAEHGAAAAGGYRYRERPFASEQPAPQLSEDAGAELKQLYRQLARRFHPDLVLYADDRAYRTDMMMRINAAYAAGDLARLQKLALEPDSVSGEYYYTDQELVAALRRELESCQRRLLEIQQELGRLERHESSRRMQQADKLAAMGRDYFAEMWRDLQKQMAEKRAERDNLESEREEQRDHVDELLALDDLADTIYDLGLEQALLGEDATVVFEEWTYRGRNPLDWGNDDDDSYD
jgi:chromosome segregation ATPase